MILLLWMSEMNLKQMIVHQTLRMYQWMMMLQIINDDIDWIDPKNMYKNYPNKTSATTFCASNLRDKFEMTANKESELPIEPIDKFESTSTFEAFGTLSDKDGDETNLFQRHTRFYSKKETKIQQEIEEEFMGQETVANGIIWKVKFNIKEKNRQENEQCIESLQIPGSRAWDNTFSPLLF